MESPACFWISNKSRSHSWARVCELESLFAFRFVKPVGGDAAFGHMVHGLGANLNFQWLAVRADQNSVQGLVAIRLGYCDIVLKAARHGFKEIMGHAQRPITLVHANGNDPKGINIEHFGEGKRFRRIFS